MPLIHKVAIVNEKGDVRGYLRVAVQVVVEEENADFVNGVKQSAKIAFEEEAPTKNKKMLALNEKNNQHNLEDRIVEGQDSNFKIEGILDSKLFSILNCCCGFASSQLFAQLNIAIISSGKLQHLYSSRHF